MKRLCAHTLLALILVSAHFVSDAKADDDQPKDFIWGLEAGFAPQTFSGGAPPLATVSPGFSFRLSRELNSHLMAQIDYAFGAIYTDSTAATAFQLGSDQANRISSFQIRRLSATLRLKPFAGISIFRPYIGGGLGANMWKVFDGLGQTALDTLGERNTRTEFKATELIVSSLIGLETSRVNRLGFGVEFRADYHTGAGAEFASLVNDTRPRWLISLGASVKLFFGSPDRLKATWRSEGQWDKKSSPSTRGRQPRERDSDGDGIFDSADKCPATPRGAEVNSVGCPTDSDGDGVYDGLDDCAKTPPTALGLIDIYGCPIDSDFDGKPDFEDRCPDGPVGAHVDQFGCPLDSDSDGTPDGLDDCPNTKSGLAVDDRGCLDLSYFARPMTLNIKYESGSFEVDRKSEEKLSDLANMLQEAPEITLEIIGYTDNIGPANANRKLSGKRARRVRDFLLRLGIAKERMRPIGRGETKFVADNSTRQGRQRNRRIEILFRGL